jgi:hypothetical protein
VTRISFAQDRRVHHRPRVAGTSSGANPRVGLRAFLELARLRRTSGRPTAGSAPA